MLEMDLSLILELISIIIVLPNFNNNQVLTDCILALQAYFAIDQWSINQPILLRDLFIFC
jgi:hypothetical protein